MDDAKAIRMRCLELAIGSLMGVQTVHTVTTLASKLVEYVDTGVVAPEPVAAQQEAEQRPAGVELQ